MLWIRNVGRRLVVGTCYLPRVQQPQFRVPGIWSEALSVG